MKICFVLPNLAGGGAEKATIDLVYHLQRRGHQIDIILLSSEIFHEIPKGIKIHILKQHKTIFYHGIFKKFILAREFKKLWGKLNNNLYFDATFSRLPYAHEIVHLSKIKAFYIIDNALSEEILRIKNNVSFLKAFKRTFRYKNIFENKKLIAVSEGVKKDLISFFNLQENNIHKIYNPVDFDSIKVKARVKNITPSYRYAIHVGRFNKQKRHDLLLDAWKNVRSNVKLIFLTDLPISLLKLVNDKDLNHRVIVETFKKNPYPWIKNAEILILCSDYEGFGLVIVEALACGTKVISTDCNYGPSEILGKDYSALVKCGDSEELAKTIDKELSNKFVNKPVIFKKCTINSVLNEYEKIIKYSI
jgi:glycosyltransferase involved in cell wall biosynthesis